MLFPKCKGVMEEATYGRNMTIDRCLECKGIWFDTWEAEKLKGKWMSDFLDSGDVKTGKVNNKITDINCPQCSVEMTRVKDMEQPHIGLWGLRRTRYVFWCRRVYQLQIRNHCRKNTEIPAKKSDLDQRNWRITHLTVIPSLKDPKAKLLCPTANHI